VVEPFLPLGEQTWLWTVAFYVLILLIAGCGVLLLRSPNVSPAAATARSEETASPTWHDRLAFVGLAAVPSGLLLAVTLHISTDAAAVPLFWVGPLAIYLLTFVIAFQSRPVIPHWLVVKAFPFVIVALAALMIISPFSTIVGLVTVHLSAFFVIALLCHGELARRRPPPQFLTGFYMLISAGGMIGGIAVGLIAPQVFNWVAEYPLLIALSVLCMPGLALPAQGIRSICALRCARHDSGVADDTHVVGHEAGGQPDNAVDRRPSRPDRVFLARRAGVRCHHRFRSGPGTLSV
jgi:hypothetical protein